MLSWQQAQVMLQSCISRPRESVPLLRAILLDNFQQQHNTEHGIKGSVDIVGVSVYSTDHMIHSMV